MKSFLSYLIKPLSALSALFIFGCDSFVEVDLPKSQLAAQTVYEDYNTATAALMNVYASLRDRGIITGTGTGISNQLGCYADEIVSNENPTNPSLNFYRNALLPGNTVISGYWNASYSQIYSANLIMEGTAGSTNLTQPQKKQLKGEALFIRALVHFYLVNLFGDIPYITGTEYTENRTVARRDVSFVYAKITEDLENSIRLLGPDYLTASRVRPNSFTVKALLARMYLYQNAYPEAANTASSILNNSQLYSLETPDRAFLLASRETLWQLHAGAAGRNTAEATYFTFSSVPPPQVSLSAALTGSFQAGDLRKSLWTRAVTRNGLTFYHAYKYKENNATNASREYSIVFRLAEQYLIRAEARARQGELIGAKEDLNVLRHRAGLADTGAVTQQEIIDAVLQERKWEFFTEYGHRFLDLKRTGQLDAVLSAVKLGWNSTDCLFPIPQSELSANPFLGSQNPGY